MPRFPRINFEGALYYVATKADHKLNLFRDDSDKSYYISLISDYKSQYKFKLYTLALISNETHLLIKPSSDFTISQIMHDINANYTKYYNKKYERKGHLFKERFKAIFIEKAQYLLEMTRYIHRIVLKENPIVELKDYKWSSYLCYINLQQDTTICPNVEYDEVLSLFSETSGNRPGLYQDFVEKAGKDELGNFSKRLYRTSVVGTKEFVKKIKQLSITAQKEPPASQAVIIPGKRIIKRWIPVFASLVVVFLGINLFLLKSNEDLKKAIKEVSIKGELEYTERLRTAKENLKKDLEEKHRADLVSYKVMARNLEKLQGQRKVDEL